MAAELRRNVINMKSLDQNIKDPIIAGGGDANGRSLVVIFTQEAAAQITPDTRIYLKWRHQQENIIGYNVFTHDSEKPQTWSIFFPRAMLREGDVTACIELVDDISVAPSTTFNIHVLSDPFLNSRAEASDDFTEFQKAAIALGRGADEAYDRAREQANTVNQLINDMNDIRDDAVAQVQSASEAADRANAIAEYYEQGVVQVIDF